LSKQYRVWRRRLRRRQKKRLRAVRAWKRARDAWRAAKRRGDRKARRVSYAAMKAAKARASALKKKVAKAKRRVAALKPRPRLRKVVGLDGCPVPYGLSLAVQDARRNGWTGRVVSGDRREGVAERFGKSSQAALWRGWVRRLPGFNPANPPGASTHERRHDGSASLRRLGAAYEKPRGALLKWWQTGLDVTNASQLVAVLNRLGYSAVRPYPDPREAHHVNFRRDPYRNLRRRGLYGKKKKAKKRKHPRDLSLSKRGVDLIASFEGFRSHPYRDAVGVWTIGYGHTRGVGPNTRPVTRAQALALLREDARHCEQAIRRLGVPMTQAEFDATVSLCFNLGVGVLDRGRSFGDAIRARKYRKAANAMLLYVHAGGRKLPGLVRRRKAERRMFLGK